MVAAKRCILQFCNGQSRLLISCAVGLSYWPRYTGLVLRCSQSIFYGRQVVSAVTLGDLKGDGEGEACLEGEAPINDLIDIVAGYFGTRPAGMQSCGGLKREVALKRSHPTSHFPGVSHRRSLGWWSYDRCTPRFSFFAFSLSYYDIWSARRQTLGIKSLTNSNITETSRWLYHLGWTQWRELTSGIRVINTWSKKPAFGSRVHVHVDFCARAQTKQENGDLKTPFWKKINWWPHIMVMQ